MKSKKIYLLALLLLVCILSISTISAAENTTKENVMSADNNQETNVETINQYDYVSNRDDNSKINLEENNYNDEESESERDKTTTNDDPLNFNDLNTTINDNTNSTIYLSDNYKYNSTLDNNFKSGILISRNLTIYGNGVTIDGNNIARMFRVFDSNLTVNFYNINFINGNATNGGAIFQGNAINCRFIKNQADYGGAIYMGNAINCTFIENKATEKGGATYYVNAYNCTFTGNKAIENGGAISKGIVYNCNFTENKAEVYGGAIGYGNAYNCTFTGNKANGNGGAIYKGTAYNCTFTKNIGSANGGGMSNGDAINCIFINNIAGGAGKAMYGGKAILCKFENNTYGNTKIISTTINILNYTSTYMSDEKLKFNLTAEDMVFDGYNTTIEIYKDGSLVQTVYGLTGEGWIVNLKPGTYTAELSLTDYIEEPSSNATIIVSKCSSKITAKHVSTIYNVGKNLIITLKDSNGKAIKGAVITVNLGSTKKYKTNSKGQIKINIATLTPKTYNAKIRYDGSDIYKGSTASVKVTVKKATPKIIAKSASYKLKIKTKKYTVNLKDNKNKALKNTKVSLKVNGKTYSVKTNNKGQGVFKINTLKKKGSYAAVITVPTNHYYNKVSKMVKITVKP